MRFRQSRMSVRLFLFSAAAVLWAFPAGLMAAYPPEADYWQLLSSRYGASSENYAEALLEEFSVFEGLYPHSTKNDSLTFMKATLYSHRKLEAAELATWLKLFFVYPQSALVAPARDRLKAIAEAKRRGITTIFTDDNYEVLKSHVLKLLDENKTISGGQQGWFDFLQLAADARVKELADYLVAECRQYLYRANNDYRAAQVSVIAGDMQQLLEKWRSALLAYGTAEILEPYGEATGEGLVKAGQIHLGPLKNYEMARRTFGEVIAKLPADLSAARASVLISEVDEAEQNYVQAVLQLEDTAQRFPFPEIRMEAYGRIARLYLDRLNEVDKALGFYQKIIDEFPAEPRTAEVLARVGKVHEDRTKKWSAAVEAYGRIAEMFPESPLAPNYLYR
ncbi:MAG TPA: tetratricopeptide repeat protein, partial [Candidatus Glassbacteria bacterium]|nr:tetratricopeptide repeat protein [Candidatus Glassbacteria bacterium]